MKTLFAVVPCYNEEDVLPQTAAVLSAKWGELIAAGKISEDSRILFVDDGSTDRTWNFIEGLFAENSLVQGLRLSRNRGHQNALLAGLLTAKDEADAVVSLDADLQDDVDAIDEMLEKCENGADIVYGVRRARKKDSFFKRFTAESYYRILKRLGAKVVFNHADFRLMTKRALDTLAEYTETNLFLRGLVPMIGYPNAVVYYDRKERLAGESKYPLSKMLALAWEGITALSVRPIRLVTGAGVCSLFVSLGLIIYSIVRLCIGATVSGWTSLMVSIWLLGGLQLLAIGIVGEYIGKIYLESKRRPRFTVDTYLKK